LLTRETKKQQWKKRERQQNLLLFGMASILALLAILASASALNNGAGLVPPSNFSFAGCRADC
jgi:hypothetical protein